MEKQIVYDLLVTLEEVERLARAEPSIRGQAILGDPLRTKPIRVLVSISSEGLSLWDVRTKVSHRWADRAPADLTELAALLKTLGG